QALIAEGERVDAEPDHLVDGELFFADFAIFTPSARRCCPCTQWRTTGWPSAPSDCAISSSWCGKMLSTPPVCRSKRSPRYFVLIAEHSMCQPGKPGPHGESHTRARPVSPFFQSAKSAVLRFCGSTS